LMSGVGGVSEGELLPPPPPPHPVRTTKPIEKANNFLIIDVY